MTDLVRDFWNHHSPADFDASLETSGRRASLQSLAALASPALSRPGLVAVDLGCGTGLLERELPGVRWLGVDRSWAFLTWARPRLAWALQGDLLELPLQAASVDVAVLAFVVEDYANKRPFWAEVGRILKPDGRFFFAAYGPRDDRMGTLKTGPFTALTVPFPVFLEEPGRYAQQFAEVGFQIERQEWVHTTAPFDRARFVAEVVAQGKASTARVERWLDEVGIGTVLRREFWLCVARKGKAQGTEHGAQGTEQGG